MYKEVDVIEYIKLGVKRGFLVFKPVLIFNNCKKTTSIIARQGILNEEVQTILNDGTKETEIRKVKLDKITNQPDWIVNNINTEEKWLIEDSIFKKKYELEKDNIYRPKNNIMLAAQIKENIIIKPPKWNGDIQRLNSGSYLLLDPNNQNDIYGIGELEFNNTYKILDNKN